MAERRPASPRFEDVPHLGVESFTTRQFDLPHFPFVWHHHPEIELTFILEGHGIRYVGDSIETFNPGDFCLLAPYLPHTWASTEDAGPVRSLVLHFLPTVWQAATAHVPEMKRINRLIAGAGGGLSFGIGAARRCQPVMQALFGTPTGSARRVARLIDLLDSLAEPPEARTLAANAVVPNVEGRALLTRVLAQLNEAGNDPPPQAEMAAAMRMSAPAFSRAFKRQMGKTYVDYATDWRLGHACRLLAQTDDDITAVAFASGFNNLSNFNRQFKASRGVTPRAYRAMSRSSGQ